MRKSSASHKPEGKWAIEAFDFLRLFRRVGRSFLGLLFLEIGWTCYILLLNKIIGSNPNPAFIWIPIWPGSARGLRLGFDGTTLLVLGSILILIGWVFYSGFYKYLQAIIWHIVKPIIFALIVVLAILLNLTNLLLMPVTWPLEIRGMKLWKKQHRAELRKMVRELRQGKGNWRGKRTEVRGQVEKTIREKLPYNRWILRDRLSPMLGKLLMRMYSFGAIGFAPLASYSYEEDLQAAKVPVQTFAWAISKTRIQLRGLEALNWIRFKFLPVHFLVTTTEKAEFTRRLFQLDVLLWGSYSTADETTIWLNIQQRLKTQKSDERRSDESSSNEVELFPLLLELDAPAVTLSQDDPAEAHTLLLVVIILILQNRWNTRQESRSKNFDRLYLLHHRLPEMLNKLVDDAFLSITDRRLRRGFLPSTNVVLTEIVGQWVGHQLNTRASAGLNMRSIERLQVIAMRCTELVPDRAEHFYRLGAYKCLANDQPGALDSFFQAGTLDSKGREVDPVMDQSLYALALADGEREVGIMRDFALAKSAAHAARALNNRNERTITYLNEHLAAHKGLQFGGDTPGLMVIKHMLEAESKKDTVTSG